MGDLKVLFISHTASRSGAPIALLHLIRWFRQNAKITAGIVLGEDGPMSKDFAVEGRVQNFEPAPTSLRSRVLRRTPIACEWVDAWRAHRCRRVVDWPPDLVYCNSIASARLTQAIGPYPCPVLVHVHELQFAMEYLGYFGNGTRRVIRVGNHFIACAEAVRKNLIGRYGVGAEEITVVHESICTGDFNLDSAPACSISLRSASGIPTDVPVLGCVGTVEWRKGADLVVPLARRIFTRQPATPLHLVWVGGGSDLDRRQLLHDISTAGFSQRVHLLNPTAKIADWYPAFTALAVLSREDPFPLVALEAAASGVPIICFEGGGGMPEFVESDAGIVVPYLDLEAFAEAVIKLSLNSDVRDHLGRRALAKVRSRHDINVAAPQILNLMMQLIEQRSALTEAR